MTIYFPNWWSPMDCLWILRERFPGMVFRVNIHDARRRIVAYDEVTNE
jgi:hypothetical protein